MMNKADLQELGGLIEEKLEPIKKTLEKHGEILDEHTLKLDGISDHLADVSVDVTEIKDKLDFQGKRIRIFEDHLSLSSPAE